MDEVTKDVTQDVTEEVTHMEKFLQHLTGADTLIEAGVVLVKIALLIIIGLIVIKLVLHITRKALKKSSADPVLHTFVINAVKTLALLILITMCLGVLGISMTTIIAVVGAAGAAIALALRDSLANIAGGVMIIITQPFHKGDLIDVGEVSGKVEDIDLFLTTLKTYDNKTITIPNGLINTSVLVNHSMEDNRRVDCTFGIGYDNDIAKAKEILKTVCESDSRIYRDPEPLIGVANHGDNAVILDLKAWCKTDDYWDVKYYLEENVKLAFDENDIQIPYP
ncbi:MAG: mechanosensitive ion channel family protein, partial [Bacillota bacterium]|nr:mechanosensitive ion channel family protein [Bacillota bacterium]